MRSRQRQSSGFDLIDPVHERYARQKTSNRVEIWEPVTSTARESGRAKCYESLPPAEPWNVDGASESTEIEARPTGLNCWFADLPADKLEAGARIVFTLRTPEFPESQYSVEMRD